MQFGIHIKNMKKILSTVIALSLLSTGIYATPSMADITVSPSEALTDTSAENFETSKNVMPSSADILESEEETDGNEKPDNYIPGGDAFLMFDVYSGGDGTKESPYQISDSFQLEYFAQSINSGEDIDKHYILTDNIDLGGASWTPVGFYSNDTEYGTVFSGSFDGNGFTVSNFKISNAPTKYIGFFGLVYNGEIKNLTLENVTVNTDRTDSETNESFAGVLAGRVVAQGDGKESNITNCKVKNSSLTHISDKTTYAGGLIGLAIAGTGAQVNIFGAESDCDVSLTVNAKKQTSSFKNHPATAGGLIGYISAVTGGTFSLRAGHSTADVSSDGSLSSYVNVFAGGCVGHMATISGNEVGGAAFVSSCSSTGKVKGTNTLFVNVGGFAGNIGATKSLFLSDCYASGNSEATSNYDSSSVGGFAGQIDFNGYSDSMGKTISSCYASGNVIDTRFANGANNESYVGGFVGYSFAPLFEQCYFLGKSTVTGQEIFTDKGITSISDESSSSSASYVGFDFENVWAINPDAEYSYPTLRKFKGVALFYSEGKYYDEMFFADEGKIVPPSVVPQKGSTKEKTYTFSHWSLTENGEKFDFATSTLNENTVFHAVFAESNRKYSVNFSSEGEIFSEPLSVEYGQKVTLPSKVPSKPDSGKYRYVFSHWSETENGTKTNFDTFTVTGNITFYAVFNQVDKTAWDGNIADSFKEGHGTDSLPYVISSAEELALFAKVTNEGNSEYAKASYILGDDINLGHGKWTPVGTAEHPFSGKLDGNGYTVKNFKIEYSQYTGFFGYVRNAEIRNLNLENFDFSSDVYTSSEMVYVGGLAGFIDCYGKDTLIEDTMVSSSKMNISSSAPLLYAGGLTGYVNAKNGDTTIKRCLVTSDISVNNSLSTGVTVAGGLAGYMYTYSNAVSSANNCYFAGSIYGYGAEKSIIGGLVGTVSSYGSMYTPSVPILAENSSDLDIMLTDCFSAATVTSVCDENNTTHAFAGAIAAEITQFADVSNVFYLRGSSVNATGKVYTCGTSASKANLVSEKFLSETLRFDFEKVWTFVSGKDYPVLKLMYSNDKPTLKINSVEFDDETLTVNVSSYAKSDFYTVTVSVYDERGRLVGISRKNLTSEDALSIFDVTFKGLVSPYKVKVSAIDYVTLSPLFTSSQEYV